MSLTDREARIMDLLLEGKRDKEIARALNCSPETVRTYVRLVEAKLDAPTRIVACVRYDRLKR